jgi:hypothetical protein
MWIEGVGLLFHVAKILQVQLLNPHILNG